MYTPDELKDALGTLLRSRHGDIADGGIEIAKLLAATNKTLKVSKGAPPWKAYVEYVNEIVIDGFSDSILASLRHLRNQVDPVVIAKQETAPLLEISLELQAKTIAWVPEVGVSPDGDGVRDQFNSWVCNFVSIGTLVKRLDVSEGNYIKEMSEDYVVGNAVCEVMNIVLANEGKCNKFRGSYEKFAYLWQKDLNATLAEFLEEHGTVDENGIKDEPSLEKFDEEVARYKAVQAEIKELPASKVIGWLKIDAKPLKQALATWVTKWIYLYTQHLSNRVVNSIQELYTFMGAADMTLDMQVKKEEPEEVEYGEEQPEYQGPSDEVLQKALYSVMGCMRDVRKRTDRTDAMFKPLGQCVDLLGKYGIVLEDKTLKQLEEASMSWEAVKKKMFNVREQLSNEQQNEARKIRLTSDSFQEKVVDFRKYFKETAPFAVPTILKLENVDPSYELLNHFAHGTKDDKFSFGSVTEVVAESAQLNESQELFELYVSDYIDLRRCSEELTYLKGLWDTVSSDFVLAV